MFDKTHASCKCCNTLGSVTCTGDLRRTQIKQNLLTWVHVPSVGH